MRILLADDDTGVIQSVLAILKSVQGHEIRVAMTGERALENATAMGGVDLLIADVVMEPMDGFTLRENLRAQFPAVRTILISGYDLSDYSEQTRDHQVLAKPIDPEVLLAAIEREFAAPPEPESPPEPVAATVPRPIAVPQARVAQPAAVAPQVVARPVAVPQATVVRAVAAPTGQPDVQPASGVRAVPAVRASAVQPSPRARASPGATATPRASAVQPRAIAIGQPTPVEAAPEPAAEPVPDFAPETSAEIPPTGLVGQTLGAYQILSLLGEGRWGSVYAAVQTAINRPVGLKVLDPERAQDPGARTRFIADARAKAGVQHPAILAVYEAGEAGGCIFYAHEYVDGRNMAEIKAGGETLDEITALKVLRTAADGLAYLHIHKIPHNAPEPRGIYLGADGGPRLANLATQVGDEQLSIEGEIQALGRIILSVLPAIQSLSPGLQDLVKRMVQKGPQAITNWGPLLQGIKALEPKIVPVEAAKISAQDRAAVAAVAQLRQKKKRALYINLASFVSLVVIVGLVCWKFLGSNERLLNDQIHVPAGEFLYGNGDPVTLPEFWIDKYEVTYGQYAQFVKHLENRPTTEYDDPQQPRIKAQDMHKPRDWNVYYGRALAGQPVHSVAIDLNSPVMQIDWWDAAAYAKWKGRELPTEQEWEKAARGTKGFIYPWGDEPDQKKANSNADYHGGDTKAKGNVDGFVYWAAVDKLKSDKSAFGVIGMAGNVAEWVATWDPIKKQPIVKGGSFMSADLRLDRRSELDPNSTSEAIGFRTISRTPPDKK